MVSTMAPISFEFLPSVSMTSAVALTLCSISSIFVTELSMRLWPCFAASAVSAERSETPCARAVVSSTCPSTLSTLSFTPSMLVSCASMPFATSTIVCATLSFACADCCELAVSSSDAAATWSAIDVTFESSSRKFFPIVSKARPSSPSSSSESIAQSSMRRLPCESSSACDLSLAIGPVMRPANIWQMPMMSRMPRMVTTANAIFIVVMPL